MQGPLLAPHLLAASHARLPPCTASPRCAGEIVAAKEIDLAASELSELKQEAFITEAIRLQQLRWG